MHIKFLTGFFAIVYSLCCTTHDAAYCKTLTEPIVYASTATEYPIVKELNYSSILYLFNESILIAANPVVQSFALSANTPRELQKTVDYLQDLYFVKTHNFTVTLVSQTTKVIRLTTRQPQRNQALYHNNVWELLDIFLIFDFKNNTVTLIGNGQYAHGVLAPRDIHSFKGFTQEHNIYLIDFMYQFTNQL